MYSKLPFVAAVATLLFLTFGFSRVNSEGVTSTTGVTTGVTTGGTSGGTTGGTYSITETTTIITMTGLREKKSADTWRYNTSSSSWEHLTGRHVCGIIFHITSSTATVTTTDPTETSRTHNYALYVEPGTEIAWPSGTPSGEVHDSLALEGGTVADGSDVYIQTSDTSTIESGRHLKWYIADWETHHFSGSGDTNGSKTWGSGEYNYLLIKLGCGDASVTSRKTYGQPNSAGELPADPNAPLRSVKFGAWDFKGGLFLGSMPGSGKDASGVSRIDLFPGGSSYDHNYALGMLSVYDEGKPSLSGLSGSLDIGVYIPNSVDSGVTESNVNWDNQFSITPGTYDSSATSWNVHPYKHQTLTDGNSDDYVIYQLPTSTSGSSNYSLSALTLAIVDESGFLTSQGETGTPYWHYIASKEFQDTAQSFPRNDCAPRVWVLQAYSP